MDLIPMMILPESFSSTISQLNDILNGTFITKYITIDAIQSITNQLNSSIRLGLLIVCLIIALLGCFFGFKFARFIMALTGFFMGMGLGYLLASQLFNLQTWLCFMVGLCGALFLAGISFWIYRLLIFILCFMFTFIFAAELIPFTNDIQFFLCTLAGFIVGAISQKFLRPVIIMTSSIAFGIWAGFIAMDLAALMNVPVPSGLLYKILAGVICSAIGMVIQFLTTREKETSISD